MNSCGVLVVLATTRPRPRARGRGGGTGAPPAAGAAPGVTRCWSRRRALEPIQVEAHPQQSHTRDHPASRRPNRISRTEAGQKRGGGRRKRASHSPQRGSETTGDGDDWGFRRRTSARMIEGETGERGEWVVGWARQDRARQHGFSNVQFFWMSSILHPTAAKQLGPV